MKNFSALLIIVLIFLSAIPIAEAHKFSDFYKFILKNYRVGVQQRSTCKPYYATIILQTDKSNRVVSFEVKSENSEVISNSLTFLKNYRFPIQYDIKERSIMFFLTFDLEEICPKIMSSYTTQNSILSESLGSIGDQLKKNPHTIILYDVIPIKVWKPRH